jgi:hypothetical protein
MFTLATVPLYSCGSIEGKSFGDTINVQYSTSVDQNDTLELSIYNPTDVAACTSDLNWLDPRMLFDLLHVVGRDGQSWEYIGPEAMIAGRVPDLRIAPHSSVSTRVNLREYYKPRSSDTRISKVYYGAVFHRC